MHLYCLTQENYPGLSKKTKDKLPLAKSKTARSAARPPLLGWRCALVCILVFSFHLLSSSRRWLRWIDSGFLSEWFSVQARSVAYPFLWSSLFFLSKWGLRKILSLSTERLKESLTQIKLFLRQDPPLDLSFWSFLTFLHHGIEEVERHLLWKFYKKIRMKSWSNVPPKLVACIGFLYKVVHKIGRLRKFNRSRGI